MGYEPRAVELYKTKVDIIVCMGILQAYAIYRYGKSRQKKSQRLEEEFWEDVCDLCGYTREQHARDAQETCPDYSN